ncbi:uncharacterized protein OCT59_009589 [Rhizophagus irregularis]|uniref:uncharacterized protein n=1 Tax=Rhizophagus irregularis TaxID=588596 RepID=UPI00332C9CE9|nr:hypothetical protein OCT59_009589 [Rhizophagus irregularis]
MIGKIMENHIICHKIIPTEENEWEKHKFREKKRYGKKIFPLRIYRSESLYSPPNNVLEISEQKIDISSASFLANQKNYVETKFLSNKTSTTVRMFRIIVTRNLHRPIYSRPVCSKFLISKPPGELRNTSSIGTTTGPSNKSPSDKLEDTSSIGTTTDPSNKSPSGESRRYISSGSSLIDERVLESLKWDFYFERINLA